MLCLLQWSKDKETEASQYEQGGDSKKDISYNIVCYVCYSGVRMKRQRLVSMNKEKMVKSRCLLCTSM